MIGSSLITFYILIVFVFGRIDKSTVNTAFDFHREGLLASASSEAEALSDAIFLFERAVRLQPRNATMWHDLGVAHMRSENWENADDCFLASMELSEKKMSSRGGSGAATRRALSIYKSAMNNREEIVMYLDAINVNRNLFTASSSNSGSTGGGVVNSVDRFKYLRSYSRLLSGRSVGVANGLVDEFNDDDDDDDINDEDTVNEDDGNNSASLLSCLRKEQLESNSLYSSSPLISVIPAALLFSSPDLFLDHQFIPTLIHLNELDSWQILRRRKVDDSSRTSQWWQRLYTFRE
jgi:tetratricopeptide (TPR) repeat protein